MTDTDLLQPTQWFAVKDIPQHYPVSEAFVRKLIREGAIKVHRLGRKILIRREDFEAVIEVVEPFNTLVKDYL